jgi:hypothetical protein
MFSNPSIETLRATTLLTVAGALCSACAQDRATAPDLTLQLMGPRTAEGEFIGNLL